MRKKPLTNNSGQVRELTRKDIRSMRTPSEVLPAKLMVTLTKRKRAERGAQQRPRKVSVTLLYSPEIIA